MDDDILLVKSLNELTDMRHDAFFVLFNRRVYKLACGAKQVWNAFMVAVPRFEVFARAETLRVVAFRGSFHPALTVSPCQTRACSGRTALVRTTEDGLNAKDVDAYALQ